MKNTEDFIKVGRIYWIKPTPTPGFKAKSRPAIALEKYGKGKTVFLQLGSTKFAHKDTLKASEILIGDPNYKKLSKTPRDTFVHIDASKPEWNTSVLKPHHTKGGEYLDLEPHTRNTLRKIYHKRRKELEGIRIKKAKISIIHEDFLAAKKQIQMLKNQNPIKHESLDVEEWIKKYTKILK